MKISGLYERVETFRHVVTGAVPGPNGPEIVSLVVHYRYLPDDVVLSALKGEAVELEGVAHDSKDPRFLVNIVKYVEPFGLFGETVELDQEGVEDMIVNHVAWRRLLNRGYLEGRAGVLEKN